MIYELHTQQNACSFPEKKKETEKILQFWLFLLQCNYVMLGNFSV